MREVECFPNPSCRCCVCQGKFCLIPHPGHWHGEHTDLETLHQTLLEKGENDAWFVPKKEKNDKKETN